MSIQAIDNAHLSETFHTIKPMRLMVLGHARHGKDTVCEVLRDEYGMSFKSSSEMACEIVIYPIMRKPFGYNTIEECFNDRISHRATWYQLIREYNTPDQTKLARAIYSQVDIYCGIRHIEEFNAVKDAGLFDFAVWVDAHERHAPEASSSCSVTCNDADYFLDNNGTLDELKENITHMMRYLRTLQG